MIVIVQLLFLFVIFDLGGYAASFQHSLIWIYPVSLLVSFLFILNDKHRSRIIDSKAVFFFGVLLFTDLAAYLVSHSGNLVYSGFVNHVIFICCFILCRIVINKKGIQRVLVLALLGGVVLSFLLLTGLLEYNSSVPGRFSLTFINPNVFGQFCIILFYTSLTARFGRFSFLYLVGVISSMSRACMLFSALIILIKTRKRITESLLFFGVLSGFIIIAANNTNVLENFISENGFRNIEQRVENLKSGDLRESASANARWDVAKIYLMKIEGGLFFGTGLSTVDYDYSTSLGAHNMLLFYLHRNGLVGVFLLVWAIYRLGLPNKIIIFLIALSFFSHNLFDINIYAFLLCLRDEDLIRNPRPSERRS